MATTENTTLDTMVNDFKQQVKTLIEAMATTDMKSKDLFTLSYKILKSSVSIKEGVKTLNDIIDIDSDKHQKHFIQRVKRIVKVASIAVETKLLLDSEKLKWYNLEKATKLMEHVKELYPDDITKVKNKLNKIKNKFVDKVNGFKVKEYNDEYDSILHELAVEYKMELNDEQKFVKVETMVSNLSNEYKQKLLQQLQKELQGNG